MVQLIKYDFRIGYQTLPLQHSEMCLRLSQLAKKFVFQKEKGEETGYVHWQGRVSLWKKTTPKKAKFMFLEQMDIKKDYYFAPTCESTTSSGNAFSYVMKLQTRMEGPWSEKDKPSYIPKQYRKVLRPWQKQIIDSKSEFDERGIDVIVDIEGNIGKSVCMGIAKVKYKWHIINPFDEGRRIIENTCSMLIGHEDREPHFIMDVPRALDNTKKASVFAALETIKSGIVSDSRNNYKEWQFDSPRIWVFTNNNIPKKYFTNDRWRFWKVSTDSHELVPY